MAQKPFRESGTSGFIKRLPEETAPEIKIDDSGKTHLIPGGINLLFSNDWIPVTTTFAVTSYETKRFKTIELKYESGDSTRYFRFALTELADKKIWLAGEGCTVSYRKTIGSVRNSYLIKQSGKIELISESNNEIVFKITNLKLKKLASADIVQIDGYIHAAKIQYILRQSIY